MRILAHITKIEIRDEFFVITAKDVRKWYHTLFFKEDKWKQIKNSMIVKIYLDCHAY